MTQQTCRPSELLFSQTSIKSTLTNGDSIPELIRQISSGRRGIDPSWLPLNVAQDKYNGKWYSQDNRRLYIFRVLEKKGLVDRIKVSINIKSPFKEN